MRKSACRWFMQCNIWLLCNAMIQPFFDYACNAWYPNLNKKLKKHLQAAQNKCIRFCLKLGDRASLKSKDLKK